MKLSSILASVLVLAAASAHASVAFLLEEPYGEFGAFNPTGHAAVYLNHVCAESPTELRMCRPGELGVVISRYHKVDGYDWVAIPLIPYLYAVDSADEVPVTVDKAVVLSLRDTYRRNHLENMFPDTPDDKMPSGNWTELVGSSYDRTIHGFQIDTTPEQDERFVAEVNDKRNTSHFNLFFHNCADFSRVVLDSYFPHAIHRNFIADAGLTTPKQVARSLMKFAKKHPEANMTAFVIPQVPGTIRRSHPVDGVAESLVKSKRYLIPLAILAPEVTGGVVATYLVDGRVKIPKDVTIFKVGDLESMAETKPPVPGPTGE